MGGNNFEKYSLKNKQTLVRCLLPLGHQRLLGCLIMSLYKQKLFLMKIYFQNQNHPMQLSWPQTLKEVLHQGNHACNVLEQKKGQILEAKISDFLYQSSFYTVMTFPSWRYGDSGSVLYTRKKTKTFSKSKISEGRTLRTWSAFRDEDVLLIRSWNCSQDG